MKSPVLGKWPNTPPKAYRFIQVIRSLAQHSERVIWGTHALKRFKQRDSRSDLDLNPAVARRVLRTGDIEGKITAGDNSGEWKVKVIGPVSHDRGARNVGVVVIQLSGNRLFVKSVEWENKR